jgi:hypothetical protein
VHHYERVLIRLATSEIRNNVLRQDVMITDQIAGENSDWSQTRVPDSWQLRSLFSCRERPVIGG